MLCLKLSQGCYLSLQIPLLPEVMARLLAIVNGVFPVRAKELAISCIGSAAVAVEVALAFLEFFRT